MTADLHLLSSDRAPMIATGRVVPIEQDKIYVLEVRDTRGGTIHINLCGSHTRASLLAIHTAVSELLDLEGEWSWTQLWSTPNLMRKADD